MSKEWSPEFKIENPLDTEFDINIRGSEYITRLKESRVGSGSLSCNQSSQGLWLGASSFSLAPFRVDMAGAVNASSFNSSGGTITGAIIQTAASGDRIEIKGGLEPGIDGFGVAELIRFKVGTAFNASIRLRTGVSPVGADSSVEMAFSAGASSTDFEVSLKRTATNTGNFSRVTGSTADLGTSDLRWSTIYLVNDPNVSSDEKLKKDIKPTTYGLKDILKLKPVEYKWKKGDDDKKIGLLAGDVNKILPEVAPTGDSYRPTMLIPILVKAIQELNEKVNKLENK